MKRCEHCGAELPRCATCHAYIRYFEGVYLPLQKVYLCKPCLEKAGGYLDLPLTASVPELQSIIEENEKKSEV